MNVLRVFDKSRNYQYSTISIEDDCLKSLFMHALAHCPDFNHSNSVTMISLFELVIHNWSLLNALAKDDESNPAVASFYNELESADSNSPLGLLKDARMFERATADLSHLLRVVRDTPGLEPYFNGIREMCDEAETISFDYLWTIFPPGDLVLSRSFMTQYQIFIVKKATSYISDVRRRGNPRSYSIECWSYDWNGTEFHRLPVQFTFDEFKGTKSISSLHCYPLKYYRGESEDENTNLGTHDSTLREKLVKRGKRYRELCIKSEGKQMFDYNGFALSRGTGTRKLMKKDQVSNAKSL